jgi:peptide/nickel transport system permease protein
MSRPPGQLDDIWSRYRRNRLAVLGLTIVTVLMAAAAIGPYLTPYDAFRQDLLATAAPPSPEHWLGTDVLGRDMLSALIYGVRLAMLVALSTVALSMVVGVALGAVAGYLGGTADALIMRLTDILLAFPFLIGAVVVVRAMGQGLWPVILALALLSWPVSARLMRGQALALRESEYVEAARSIGAGTRRIIVRHVLPNAIAPVLVYELSSIGLVVVGLASLSYLGVGVPADVPEWGRLISQASPFLRVPGMAHLWLSPVVAVCLTTLGFALVADGLRDALDPKLRARP